MALNFFLQEGKLIFFFSWFSAKNVEKNLCTYHFYTKIVLWKVSLISFITYGHPLALEPFRRSSFWPGWLHCLPCSCLWQRPWPSSGGRPSPNRDCWHRLLRTWPRIPQTRHRSGKRLRRVGPVGLSRMRIRSGKTRKAKGLSKPKCQGITSFIFTYLNNEKRTKNELEEH